MKKLALLVILILGITVIVWHWPHRASSYLTYQNPQGYVVEYPSAWGKLVCLDGAQAEFYADTNLPLSCDLPRDFQEFTIIGPLSKQELSDDRSAGNPKGIDQQFVEISGKTFAVYEKDPNDPMQKHMLESLHAD